MAPSIIEIALMRGPITVIMLTNTYEINVRNKKKMVFPHTGRPVTLCKGRQMLYDPIHACSYFKSVYEHDEGDGVIYQSHVCDICGDHLDGYQPLWDL